jgi:hypothetical protein
VCGSCDWAPGLRLVPLCSVNDTTPNFISPDWVGFPHTKWVECLGAFPPKKKFKGGAMVNLLLALVPFAEHGGCVCVQVSGAGLVGVGELLVCGNAESAFRVDSHPHDGLWVNE